jgi:hypothetical protein
VFLEDKIAFLKKQSTEVSKSRFLTDRQREELLNYKMVRQKGTSLLLAPMVVSDDELLTNYFLIFFESIRDGEQLNGWDLVKENLAVQFKWGEWLEERRRLGAND